MEVLGALNFYECDRWRWQMYWVVRGVVSLLSLLCYISGPEKPETSESLNKPPLLIPVDAFDRSIVRSELEQQRPLCCRHQNLNAQRTALHAVLASANGLSRHSDPRGMSALAPCTRQVRIRIVALQLARYRYCRN
jgi:hypothetical protein